jgi:hypothetical protein
VRWKQTAGKAISKKSTRIKSRQAALRGTKTRGSDIVPSDNKYKNSGNATKKSMAEFQQPWSAQMILLSICPNGRWSFVRSVGVQYGHPKWPHI